MGWNEWTATSDRLPEDGQQVLCYTPETNLYNARHEPVHIWRMDFVRGKIPGPKDTIGSADLHGNNRVPYVWRCENGGSIFGQNVTHWMPLPELPAEHIPMRERRDMAQRCSHGFTRKDWYDPYNVGGCGFLLYTDHEHHMKFVKKFDAMLAEIRQDLGQAMEDNNAKPI